MVALLENVLECPEKEIKNDKDETKRLLKISNGKYEIFSDRFDGSLKINKEISINISTDIVKIIIQELE